MKCDAGALADIAKLTTDEFKQTMLKEMDLFPIPDYKLLINERILFELDHGNISQERELDAIVIPTTNILYPVTHNGREIVKRCGPELMKEICSWYPKEPDHIPDLQFGQKPVWPHEPGKYPMEAPLKLADHKVMS